MHEKSDTNDSPSVVSNRTMDIVVALLFLVASAIVIYGSRQIGVGWRDDGPAPGFFPFYVAIIMGLSSLVNLFNAIRDTEAADDSFVNSSEFGRVLAVLVPSTLYVAAIGGIELGPINIPGLGIYVASFIFIALFMIFIGREPMWKALLTGALVPVVTFMMFEKWFRVALPKGPLEAFLGLA